MKPGMIVKISKRFKRYSSLQGKSRVVSVTDTEVTLIDGDGYTWWARPEELVIVSYGR